MQLNIYNTLFKTQMRKDAKGNAEELAVLEKINSQLIEGKPARHAKLSIQEIEHIKGYQLLTMKPMIYACNVSDSDLAAGNELSKLVFDYGKNEGCVVVLVSAQVRLCLLLFCGY